MADINTNISWQIAVYKTSTKLLEFNDKLNPAPVENYGHLHADADADDTGKRWYSNIGVVMQDYSGGTGDKLVKVSHNLAPDEICFLLSRLTAGFQEVEFSQDKIFGGPDASGHSTVTKITVRRAVTGSDGKPRKYPWYFQIENGVGKKATNKNGGIYIHKGSYVKQKDVFANLSDLDAFRMLNRAARYIEVFELTYGPKLIRDGKAIIEEKRQQAAQEQQAPASA